jgi:hypothetical protein
MLASESTVNQGMCNKLPVRTSPKEREGEKKVLRFTRVLNPLTFNIYRTIWCLWENSCSWSAFYNLNWTCRVTAKRLLMLVSCLTVLGQFCAKRPWHYVSYEVLALLTTKEQYQLVEWDFFRLLDERIVSVLRVIMQIAQLFFNF